MADGRDDVGYRWKRNKRDDGTVGFTGPSGVPATHYTGPSRWQGNGVPQSPAWNDAASRPATATYELSQGMYRNSPATGEYSRGPYGSMNGRATSASNVQTAAGASGHPLGELPGPRYGTPQGPRASTESSAQGSVDRSGSARPAARSMNPQLNGPGRGVPPTANGSHDVSSSGEIFSHHAGHDLPGQGRQQRGQPTVVYPNIGQQGIQRRLALWDADGPSSPASSSSAYSQGNHMPGMTSSGHWIRQGPGGADAAESDRNTTWPRNGGRPPQQQRGGWHAEDGSFKPIPYPDVGQYSHSTWLNTPHRAPSVSSETVTPTLSHFDPATNSPRYANDATEADRGSDGAWWSQMYRVDWKPKEVFLKYRRKIFGHRVGANVELRRKEEWATEDGSASEAPGFLSRPFWQSDISLWGFQAKEANLKVVLKPLAEDRLWKIVVEPRKGDVRFLSRKIPILGLLNVQVGVGHDFRTGATGWKWKVTSRFGGGGSVPQIGYKGTLHLCPGLDARIGVNADYVLPDMQGSLGTGEPIMGLNLGQLYASIQRLEAIFSSS